MAGDDRDQGGRRVPPSVDARHARGVQFGDHNVQHNHFAPPVRSAYLEHVRRLAPQTLLDRDAELARLAAFCAGDQSGAYLWWEARPGDGRTALLSWFVLHPPAGVRAVSFFVNGRRTARRNRDAFIDVVLEQLVELTDGSMPGHLTESTREAHLLRRYAEAAEACRRRGERLVLVVDGLGEDDGTDARGASIAALLPADGPPVVVTSAVGWRIPADVPPDHPLRRWRARWLPRHVGPEERRRAAEEAARRELRLRQAERERREAEQRARQEQAAESERTSRAARAEAARRASTLVGGWILALVVTAWFAWGWNDPGIARILTGQLLLGGLGAVAGLVVPAVRLGAAYRPALRSPAAWLPSPRAALARGAAVLAFLVLGGALAHDYRLARHERLIEELVRREQQLPGFGEVLTLVFLLLVGAGAVVAGLLVGQSAVAPWQQRHREARRSGLPATRPGHPTERPGGAAG
ncbi:hypothetical protein ACFY2R_16960 [Micromonospora olivasterospora]|uniref:Uncharacterized protein n=1 Tax=Micromonospora olivasterospora TaxID=1880 RepID=A0A562IG96_MICOL|nr:hypothetical protein [Micromonospora olivasterospora]TWH69912.1 hypothetical protein JD77_04929 [Micromonospora olivasterospora]